MSDRILPEEEFQNLILGALLHDIGKFIIRGREWKELLRIVKERCESTFGERDYKRVYKYAHPPIGGVLLEKYLPQKWQGAIEIVYSHHSPEDYLTKEKIYLAEIVQLADFLSATEREKEEAETIQTLLSIFPYLYKQNNNKQNNEREASYFYPLAPLSFAKDIIFPQPQMKGDYTNLWNQFIKEFEGLQQLAGDFLTYFNSCYYLLMKYTWCMPGAYYEAEPDISLFSHLKTTSAIAACLYRNKIDEAKLEKLLNAFTKLSEELKEEFKKAKKFKKAKEDIKLKDVLENAMKKLTIEEKRCLEEEAFVLIEGDISGLQDFLYTLTSKGVAKGLRGRSFYLQMLTEVLSRRLLKELDLPLSNLLYTGGGHFFILAHSIPEEEFKRIKERIAEKLFAIFKGELYVALAKIPLCYKDFFYFAPKWQEVSREIEKAKLHRFSELGYKPFEPEGIGGTKPTCDVCHSEDVLIKRDERELCLLCAHLEDLGRELAEANYLLISEVEEGLPKEELKHWQKAFTQLGFWIALCKKEEEIPQGFKGEVLRLGDTNFLDNALLKTLKDKEANPSLGFYFLANVTPWKGKEIADFESIAEESEGISRLGILRMDIDNLGNLFKEGLPKAKRTISHVSTLSFFLRLFFEGYIKEICKEYNPSMSNREGKDKVYVIYSGGDDLFIVSSWDISPLLAIRIKEEFTEFTKNPEVTISGGISLIPQKFPLYRSAEIAKEALDRAKKREEEGKVVKNGIDFLGITLSWEEINETWKIREKLEKIVKEENVPKVILHRLTTIYNLYQKEKGIKEGKVHYGPWMWRGAYYLERLAQSYPQSADKIREILKGLDSERNIKLTALAARWTELLLREKERR